MVNLYVKKERTKNRSFLRFISMGRPAESSLEYFSSIDDVYSLWQS